MRLTNVHPGEILLAEYLQPMNMSGNALAEALSVTSESIDEVIFGNGPITADTALRLARFFGNSAKFWLGLQNDYDLEEAELNVDLQGIQRY